MNLYSLLVFLAVWFPQFAVQWVYSGTFPHSFALCDQSRTA